MDKEQTLNLLRQVKNGETAPEDALLKLCTEPFEDLGFAKLDHHRQLRQGVSEVIYGAGKTPEQITEIAKAMLEKGQDRVLITRLSEEASEIIRQALPLEYYKTPKIGIIGQIPQSGTGNIVVASAGTSDMPVAEEAALTARFLGNNVTCVYDIGVAGLHRLIARLDIIMKARVIICVAGMEGALASVVAGLVSVPVIGVPTSVGYGASFGGVSALLSMLNSCAGGVCVVNIDNGFGAGYLASMVNK